MIPETEEPTTSSSSTLGVLSSFGSTPTTTAAPSGALLLPNHQHHHNHLQQHQQQQQQANSAWTRYRYFVEAMHSQGQAFNRKLILEAMFRGSDLVYSCGRSSPCLS